MLTQIEEGKMFLEDNDAHVELDLSQCVSLCTCYNSVVMVADESISPTEKHSWPVYRQLLHSGRRSVWRRPHFPRWRIGTTSPWKSGEDNVGSEPIGNFVWQDILTVALIDRSLDILTFLVCHRWILKRYFACIWCCNVCDGTDPISFVSDHIIKRGESKHQYFICHYFGPVVRPAQGKSYIGNHKVKRCSARQKEIIIVYGRSWERFANC